MSKLQLPADDSLLLLVTHSNLSTFAADIRISQQTTVEALKDKLWRKTGTAVSSMRLELRDDTGAKVADLDDDAVPLAAYRPYNGYRIHVVDLDPSSLTSGGWLEDTSLVDKYKMSDEAYDKLDTSFRKFKEKMVSKNPTSDDKESEKHMEELCSRIKVDITQQNDAVRSPSSDDHHKPRVSDCSTDKDSSLSLCRVCHCVEPDFRGESALGFLGIVPPSREPCTPRTNNDAAAKTSTSKDDITGSKDAPRFLEFISPQGEIFICPTDVEPGPLHQQDHLMDLGCSCKNELALAHYACALKWFISHGSTVCEICGNVAANVRPSDFNKVLASLKDYEALRERTYTGELSCLQYEADTTVDPDAVAAIRRQRLSEISSWFNPHNSHLGVSQGHIQQAALSPSNNSVVEHSVVAATALHTSRSLERSGVFVAMGLAVIVLAWFVAPHVGKKAAIIGLHMLLGGLCALTIIISLRFVFPRIQYGSMQYWAIAFVSWFLVFGVWASRTRSIRSS